VIVTVVTPTLNGIRYLQECVESVRKNESRGIEIDHVIVDGGSTDGTVEMARSYGLRVMQGKDNGIFDAINKGSFSSSGELLGFLGADDVMLEGGLEAIVRTYQQSGKRWVVGGIRWIDEYGNNLGGMAAIPLWLVPRLLVCLEWNPIMHMATYLSRDFYTELGGFNPDFKLSGDLELFARARSQAPYARARHLIACFRRTGENYSATNPERAARESGLVFEKYGPKSNLERRIWRKLLNMYIDLRNPDFLIRKKLDTLRWRLGLQEKKYI
jgi:glycosyltransferase involved in cell wall biosynthesis